jgi:hypothetical protein
MPDTPEAARAWRKVHMTGNRAKIPKALPELKRDLTQTKARLTSSKAMPDSLSEAEAIYAELDAACKKASQRAEQLTGSKQAALDELGRRWSVVAADLLKRKLELIQQIQALRVQSGELAVFAEVQQVFVSFLRDIRQLTEAMPSSLAMRVNPTDPVFAKAALDEWLDSFFRTLHTAPIKGDGV